MYDAHSRVDIEHIFPFDYSKEQLKSNTRRVVIHCLPLTYDVSQVARMELHPRGDQAGTRSDFRRRWRVLDDVQRLYQKLSGKVPHSLAMRYL